MNFLYEAIDQTGKPILGKIDAVNEADAQRLLVEAGYRPQSIAPSQTVSGNGAPVVVAPSYAPPASASYAGIGNAPIQSAAGATTNGAARNITLSGNAARVASRIPASKTRQTAPLANAPTAPIGSDLAGVKTRDLMFFFQQLTSLVRSGMTVYTALDNLAARTPNKNLARTAHEMAEQAHTGGRISDVMERYPRIYPEHLVGTVRAGELGGFLEVALAEVAENFQSNIALYRNAWMSKALAMQALITLAISEPAFPNLFPYADFKRYFILAFLRNLPIALALSGIIWYAGKRLQLPQYRRQRDSLSLRIRPFGDLQRFSALAKFLRTLRRLYAAGIAPIQAWEGATATVSNVAIKEQFASSYALMQQGASMPEAFAATHLFADQVEQLIVTGQQSGEMVEMLDQAIDYYQTRVEEFTSKARFAILRYGFLAFLVLGGATAIWMEYSYFHGIFKFVDDFFGQ